MLCQPITFSNEKSSHPWNISHTKPLANSSRYKASVVSSISRWCQPTISNTNQLHLGHCYQQDYDSFYGWVSSIKSYPNPTGSGVIIKKQVWNSTPIKIAKAVKFMGSSYEGGLEAIKIATEYAETTFLSQMIVSTYFLTVSQQY